MKQILVVYYTQSGQLKRITDSVIQPFHASPNYQIDYEELQPVPNFPFPWGGEFYDCFPETVKGIPCQLAPFKNDLNKKYDLVILAYQPWYLSPAIPISSFLQTHQAAKWLKETPVVTVLGARNMWCGAQEIVKKRLIDLKAQLVGNIVLADRADNYIAGITITKWLIEGKQKLRFFPKAGVADKEIYEASKFGEIIKASLESDTLSNLQQQLIKHKAVEVKFNLLNIEKNARRIFLKLADYILRQEQKSEKARKKGISLFKWYLLLAFFIISPFASITFILMRYILYPIANKQISYYKGVKYKE